MGKKISLKQLEIMGAVFGTLFGSLLHFTYELSGNSLFVGIFSAVNESVWEHTKLLFTPIILFAVVEWFWVKDKNKLLFAKAAELVFTSLFIITFFYTYTGALGIESLLVDVISFIIAVILGKSLSYAILQSDYKPRLKTAFYAITWVLIFALYVLTTIAPPRLPLFKDSNSDNYGIESGEILK